MGNSATGSYQTTPENVMAAFDKLPKEARQALAGAIENWVPQPLRTAFEKRGVRKRELVKMVRQWDRTELAKRARQQKGATGPYKGNVPVVADIQPKTRKHA